jgi:hypothetical protein
VNVASRTAFAMGRVRSVPATFAQVSERHRTRASDRGGHQSSALPRCWLGFGYDPVTAFAMIGTALVITLVSLPRHERGLHRLLRPQVQVQSALTPDHPGAWDPRLHPGLAVPRAGIKAPGLGFITPLSAPFSYMGPAVAIWMGIGVIYLVLPNSPSSSAGHGRRDDPPLDGARRRAGS